MITDGVEAGGIDWPAVEGIGEQQTHKTFKKIIIGLKNDVESGKQFSEAIQRYPKLFGPLYVNMVRASEMSGSFAKMLDRIAAYIGQQLETRGSPSAHRPAAEPRQ